MPRVRILNHDKRDQACALVAAGLSLNQAARRLGCSIKTLRRERGRNDQFAHAIVAAQNSCRIDPLVELRKAAATNWRAAAWLLERTEPQKFAPRRFVPCRPPEFDDACDHIIEAALAALPEADRPRVYTELREAADQAARLLVAPDSRRAGRSLGPLVDVERLRNKIDAEPESFDAWKPLQQAGDSDTQEFEKSPRAAESPPTGDISGTNGDISGPNGDISKTERLRVVALALRKKLENWPVAAAAAADEMPPRAQAADQSPRLSQEPSR